MIQFKRPSGNSAAALAAAIILGSLATPAIAAGEPSTKVIRCGSENCLQISGHRDNSASIVSINGHEVAVEGKRGWRASLPVDTVREWSDPSARTIDVSIQDSETKQETLAIADLPIGLLGETTRLAMIEVSIR